MRLFGKLTGTIDRFDRPLFFRTIFTLISSAEFAYVVTMRVKEFVEAEVDVEESLRLGVVPDENLETKMVARSDLRVSMEMDENVSGRIVVRDSE